MNFDSGRETVNVIATSERRIRVDVLHDQYLTGTPFSALLLEFPGATPERVNIVFRSPKMLEAFAHKVLRMIEGEPS